MADYFLKNIVDSVIIISYASLDNMEKKEYKIEK
jgi:hypothetical protein